MYKKVNEAISSQLDELRDILIESGMDEKKVNEAFQKFGEPKHTFYLVRSSFDEDGFHMSIGVYKNITRDQLSFCIMRDSSWEDDLFKLIIKMEENRWEEYRKDEILKPLIEQIESEKDWLDYNGVESKYIEHIYTKFYKPIEILDSINNCCNDGPHSWEDFGIFREDELSKFLESGIFDNCQNYNYYTIYPPKPETPKLTNPETPKLTKPKTSEPKTCVRWYGGKKYLY